MVPLIKPTSFSVGKPRSTSNTVLLEVELISLPSLEVPFTSLYPVIVPSLASAIQPELRSLEHIIYL